MYISAFEPENLFRETDGVKRALMSFGYVCDTPFRNAQRWMNFCTSLYIMDYRQHGMSCLHCFMLIGCPPLSVDSSNYSFVEAHVLDRICVLSIENVWSKKRDT